MNKTLKITISILIVFTFVTYVIGIYLSSTKSLESVEATKLREETKNLSEGNIALEAKVLTLSSYNAIASRAGELGYNRTTQFVSLYDPIEVARLR